MRVSVVALVIVAWAFWRSSQMQRKVGVSRQISRQAAPSFLVMCSLERPSQLVQMIASMSKPSEIFCSLTTHLDSLCLVGRYRSLPPMANHLSECFSPTQSSTLLRVPCIWLHFRSSPSIPVHL